MNGSAAHRGAVATLALLGTLLGCYLWASMLVAPWQLVSGMLDARDNLKIAQRALQNGAIKKARLSTMTAVAAADKARSGLEQGGPLFDLVRAVPRVDSIMDEAPHLVSALEHTSTAAQGTLDIAQNALRGPDKIIKKDPDDPDGGSIIDIERIEQVGTDVDDIRSEIGSALGDLRAVDPSALPRKLRPSLQEGIDQARDTDALLADAAAGLAILPEFLGANGPRTYLLGFQNSAELRGTGGAMLQFQLLSISNGKMRLVEGPQTVYNVDKDREQITLPSLPEDAWYVAGVPDAHRFGNANWSPDWPLSAQLTLEYARATDPDFPEVDGVFAIDPVTIQEMMPGIGRYTTALGNAITQNRAVHFVLYKAYASYPIKGERRYALRTVVDGFYKGLFDPQSPTALVEGLGSALSGKHIQAWMPNSAEQAFVKRMGWDGAIKPAINADYFYAVEQNVGGNKLDYFDDKSVDMKIRFDGSDSLVESKMSVENDVFLPQPRWSMGDTGKSVVCRTIGSCPLHRPMLNFYVQSTSQLLDASVEGTRLDQPAPAAWSGDTPATHSELGKTVWTATLQIPPGEIGSFKVGYRVPGVLRTIDGRKVYRLVLQHQPKVRAEALRVQISLPEGATDVRAPGWKKTDGMLVWERPLNKDISLEVSWRD